MLSVATFNVNSVRQRIGHLLDWLRETNVDIACLQEIKTLDEGFPRAEIEALGYNVETHGQKTFNGVAILSKLRFDEVRRGLRAILRMSRRAIWRRAFPIPAARCGSPRSICRMATPRRARNTTTSCAGWSGSASMRLSFWR